jgi:hypothetical protein
MGPERTRNGDCGGDAQQQFNQLTDHICETKSESGVWSLESGVWSLEYSSLNIRCSPFFPPRFAAEYSPLTTQLHL